jgi:NTP pyrophosphatase (non-canonical NTP hydrolase)
MIMNDYQRRAMETAIEAGEVANKVKKVLRDHGGVVTPELTAAITDELGDVLWYVASLARELGVSMEEVATVNLAKLQARRERGKLAGNGDAR